MFIYVDPIYMEKGYRFDLYLRLSVYDDNICLYKIGSHRKEVLTCELIKFLYRAA